MNNYFSLTKEQQQKVLQAIENKVGLPGQAIEKDIWVTTILQIVFTMSCAQHLIFKGGTSISKVWNLIKRFSEDIDLAIAPKVFDITGEITKKKIKKLRKASSVYVRDTFYPELQQAIGEHGLSELCFVDVEPDGEGDNTYPEPRKVWIRYNSVYPSELDYLKPVVMLEISARSLMEPCTVTKVKSMVENNYPNIQTTLVNSDITTANAEKTFLEKAFLIHEMFSVEGHGWKADRKSRHLYDLSEMMKHGIDDKAIKDDDLWESIRQHREIYTSVSGMDYTPDIRKRIVLIPREDIISAWEKDYTDMKDEMIFGDKPSFDELIDMMKTLQKKFRKMKFTSAGNLVDEV